MANFNLADYVDVQTRVNRFWTEYPDGRINTVLLSHPSEFDRVVIRAEVYKHRDHPHPDASDLAAEERADPGDRSKMVNQTSWFENCSTSAVGRALANMGYATSQKDRPSRQEMDKVNRGATPSQNGSAPMTAPEPRQAPTPARPPTMTLPQVHGIARDRGVSHDDLRHILIGKHTELASMKDATPEMLGALGSWLERATTARIAEAVERGGATLAAREGPTPSSMGDGRASESHWLNALDMAPTLKDLATQYDRAKQDTGGSPALAASYDRIRLGFETTT